MSLHKYRTTHNVKLGINELLIIKINCSAVHKPLLKRNTKPAKQTATQKKQMLIPILLTQPLFA